MEKEKGKAKNDGKNKKKVPHKQSFLDFAAKIKAKIPAVGSYNLQYNWETKENIHLSSAKGKKMNKNSYIEQIFR